MMGNQASGPSNGLGYGVTQTPIIPCAIKDTSSARLSGRLDQLDNLASEIEKLVSTVKDRLIGSEPEQANAGTPAFGGIGILGNATARIDSTNARLDRVRSVLMQVCDEL